MATKKKHAEAESFPRKAMHCPAGNTELESARNMAALVTSPELAACRVINAVERNSGLGAQIDTPAVVDRLRDESAEVNGGNLTRVEAMLMNQATALQTLFSRLAKRGMGCDNAVPFEVNMRIALRAQSQSRAALETRAAIRNPPAVFARQANVTTGPQQINNGIPAPSRARENENPPNELLEVANGERLDAGAAGKSIGSDQEMATVGALDGTQDSGR